MYSISIFIVTYRQEKLIGRAIESVLAQKDWGLKSIVIGDDCSPDNNWQVIQEYQQKYPEIIKAYRNEHNLGIYGNYEMLLANREEADLYYFLEGDDAICDGWFKAIQEALTSRRIELNGIAAAISSDYRIVRPNGLSIVAKNNRLIECKDVDPVSLKARNVIAFRSTFVTAATLERYKPVDLSKGLGVAEEMADIRPFRYSDKFYYVPFVATIYYTHIGVSMDLKGEDYNRERISQYEWLKTLSLDKKALLYQDYRIAQSTFMINPTWGNFRLMTNAFLKSFDKYTLKGEQKYLQCITWFRMIRLLIKH